MAIWKTRLEFKELWEEHRDGVKTVAEVAKEIYAKLQVHPQYSGDEELESIAERFKELSETPFLNVDEFDGVLDELYDWADRERCWVATF